MTHTSQPKTSQQVVELPQHVERIKKNFRIGSDAYKAVGADLIDAKSKLPYGQWMQWLHSNFSMSDRLARYYMELAGATSETISDLRKEKKRLKRPAEATDPVPLCAGCGQGIGGGHMHLGGCPLSIVNISTLQRRSPRGWPPAPLT